ncbi:MAG: hypothetical protein L6455_02995, partial [Kiritimatiellae bacterium]|nr:hypothetical protein [Kiritimatiellia bacterium]
SVATNGTPAESYGYDALGRRISISDGSTTSYLVYDGVQVIAETDSSGDLLKSYTYGPGIDNILSMTVYGSTTNTYYYIKDHLGSVQAIVDSSGTIVESYQYDAWGNTSVFDGSGNPLQSSAIGNRYCWQGREISWKTGLYYFRARWYEPVTGRWLSNDPIGISGGLNQYVFVDNNPVNFRDPVGLCGDGDGAVLLDGSDVARMDRAANAFLGNPSWETFSLLMQEGIRFASERGIGPCGMAGAAAKGGAQLFRHYGYAEDAAKFKVGLKPGSYTTHARGRPMGGATAQERLALPHETPPNAYYKVRVGPETPVQGPSPVEATEIPPRTGAGIQYYFPEGTPPGSIEGPFPIR